MPFNQLTRDFRFGEHLVKTVDVLPCNTASIPLASATVFSMADIEYFPACRLFNSTVPQVLITNRTGLFVMFPNVHSYTVPFSLMKIRIQCQVTNTGTNGSGYR